MAHHRATAPRVVDFCIKCFALECIAVVIVLAAQQRPQASEQVGRDEKYPPALTLLDVHPFMGARTVEAALILTEDDMTKRQRHDAVLKEHPVAQEPTHCPTLYLQNPIDDCQSAVRRKGCEHKRQRYARGGQRPKITGKSHALRLPPHPHRVTLPVFGGLIVQFRLR